MPLERARALQVRGALERRARRKERARASLEEAAGELERMGAALLAAGRATSWAASAGVAARARA